MGDNKKPWEEIPIEIIIEEEERERIERDANRPRIELPIYYPTTSASYETPDDVEDEDDEHMIIIKL